MLDYKILESKIKKISVDFDLLSRDQTEIGVKVNAIMKVPGDIDLNRVLFEIAFEAAESNSNQNFISAIGEVIIEFNEKPDYDKVSQNEYPMIAMKDIVKKIDEIIADMKFMNISFSDNVRREDN